MALAIDFCMQWMYSIFRFYLFANCVTPNFNLGQDRGGGTGIDRRGTCLKEILAIVKYAAGPTTGARGGNDIAVWNAAKRLVAKI